MGKRIRGVMLVVLVMCCYAVVASGGGYDGDQKRRERVEEREEEESKRPWKTEDLFMLHERKQVVKTDAGDMRVVKGGFFTGRRTPITEKPLHVGLITMEPKSLFIPQYLDSDLILFIRRGEARVGLIYKDEFVDRRLKIGDVYRIPAGSAFYLVNTGEGQRLHIICSIHKSEGLGWGTIQSFFISGGSYPTSILAGFDPQTLSAAFNVSTSELGEILRRQQQGPIVFLPEAELPSIWTDFLQMETHGRKQHLKRMVQFHEEAIKEEEEPIWSFRKLLSSVFGKEPDMNAKWIGKKAPDSYNLYDRKPDFRNNYGWSIALDHREYSPLGRSDVGVYLVNLTAGSMMAPHINPTATEYGIVLKGSGTIQVVFPNGTSAMNARVTEGDVFWIPRYFPFCQIASRSGPLEFFGFTTSAHKNRPQFLVGSNSILQSMKGPEFAAGFGVSEERLRSIIDAQRESVILPSVSAAPPDREVKEEDEIKRERMMPRVIRTFGNEMVMGFD